MRYVKPLSDRQWAMVVEQLKQGPTPEMRRTLQRAREQAKHIKEIDPSEVERRRRRAAALEISSARHSADPDSNSE